MLYFSQSSKEHYEITFFPLWKKQFAAEAIKNFMIYLENVGASIRTQTWYQNCTNVTASQLNDDKNSGPALNSKPEDLSDELWICPENAISSFDAQINKQTCQSPNQAVIQQMLLRVTIFTLQRHAPESSSDKAVTKRGQG